MYPPDTQNSTFLVPALDPMSIACYAQPHTSAYHISKESIMFAESRPNTNLLRFHARSSENENFLCIANFQLKIWKKLFFVTEVLKHLKNKKNKLQFYFFIFGGFSDYPVTLFSFSNMSCPNTNLHTKFQKESLNVCRIQSKYKCASFMLKQPGSENKF